MSYALPSEMTILSSVFPRGMNDTTIAQERSCSPNNSNAFALFFAEWDDRSP